MSKNTNISVSRQLRPDDIRVGDYVAVLNVSYEWAGFSCMDPTGNPGQVQRATLIPNKTSPPVRIEAVCVPFLFVVDVKGKRHMVDMRRVKLARVSRRFGNTVFSSMSRKSPGGKTS